MKPRKMIPFGDHAVLLLWDDVIDKETHKAVMFADEFICQTWASNIIETVPAYNTLAVYLHIHVHVAEFMATLKKQLFHSRESASIEKHMFTIPVCYEEPFAQDIKAVAQFHQLTEEKVIQLHTQPVYDVYFIGFLPGFPYLGNLNQRLHTPRKTIPQKHVEAGAVGIGGAQTGIYPNPSPGGWNIIGQTPLALFEVSAPQPALLQAGDKVRFEAVSTKEFQTITTQIQQGKYAIKKEVYNA